MVRLSPQAIVAATLVVMMLALMAADVALTPLPILAYSSSQVRGENLPALTAALTNFVGSEGGETLSPSSVMDPPSKGNSPAALLSELMERSGWTTETHNSGDASQAANSPRSPAAATETDSSKEHPNGEVDGARNSLSPSPSFPEMIITFSSTAEIALSESGDELLATLYRPVNLGTPSWNPHGTVLSTWSYPLRPLVTAALSAQSSTLDVIAHNSRWSLESNTTFSGRALYHHKDHFLLLNRVDQGRQWSLRYVSEPGEDQYLFPCGAAVSAVCFDDTRNLLFYARNEDMHKAHVVDLTVGAPWKDYQKEVVDRTTGSVTIELLIALREIYFVGVATAHSDADVFELTCHPFDSSRTDLCGESLKIVTRGYGESPSRPIYTVSKDKSTVVFVYDESIYTIFVSNGGRPTFQSQSHLAETHVQIGKIVLSADGRFLATLNHEEGSESVIAVYDSSLHEWVAVGSLGAPPSSVGSLVSSDVAIAAVVFYTDLVVALCDNGMVVVYHVVEGDSWAAVEAVFTSIVNRPLLTTALLTIIILYLSTEINIQRNIQLQHQHQHAHAHAHVHAHAHHNGQQQPPPAQQAPPAPPPPPPPVVVGVAEAAAPVQEPVQGPMPQGPLEPVE